MFITPQPMLFNNEPNVFLLHRYNIFGVDFWIGYHKNASNDWIWQGEDSNYTNFADGYPELHDCARTTEEGLWKDRDCEDFMNYICEKPAGNNGEINNTSIDKCAEICLI